MEEFNKLNRFSRTAGNDAKLGYFPTDQGELRKMARLIDFGCEEGREVCAVDLCAGEGDALITITGKNNGGENENNEKLKLFAVELNMERANACKSNSKIDYAIEADALAGTRCSHNVFSFAFANPPYGEDLDRGKTRLEVSFLDRYSDLMCRDGLLVLVIPHYVLTSEALIRKLLWKFTPVYAARFADEVYKDFQQCVVFAYRKHKTREGYTPEQLEAFLASVKDVSKMAYLPKVDEPVNKRLKVIQSKEDRIELFTTKEFDPELARGRLEKDVLRKVMNNTVSVSNYTGINVGKPPVPLNRNLMYTCAVAGVGQGLAGSIEAGDLHLQKGRVQQSKHVDIVQRGDTQVEVETVVAVTSMVIIDALGNIKELVGEASVREESEEDEDE